jgi:hypothetical protein
MVYRFRVSFEDYDEIIREVDMLSRHTFLDLHQIIQQSVGYNPEKPSSFFVSNDHWIKGAEIAYLPSKAKQERGVIRMEDAKLNKYIDDPHQKFYYTYHFDHPFDFHVQLIRIFKEDESIQYPIVSKSVGQAPKPSGVVVLPSEVEDKKEGANEYDFLNETRYGIDEAEDFDMLDEEENSESEETEGKDEFSDNQRYDDDY